MSVLPKLFPSVEELQLKREENIRCDVIGCGRIFKHSLALRFHMVKVHNIIKTESDRRIAKKEKCNSAKLFYCPSETCLYHYTDEHSKHFVSFKLLRQHYKQVHCSRNHSCSTCSSTFSRQSDLRRHASKCTFLTCIDCKVRMASRDELIHHGNLTRHKIAMDDLINVKGNKCKRNVPSKIYVKLDSNVTKINEVDKNGTNKNLHLFRHIKPKNCENQTKPFNTNYISPSNIPINEMPSSVILPCFINGMIFNSTSSNPSIINNMQYNQLFKANNLKVAQTQTTLNILKEKITKSQGSQVLFEGRKPQCVRENNHTQTSLSKISFPTMKYNYMNCSFSENQANKTDAYNSFINSETQTLAKDSAEHISTQTIESFLNSWSKKFGENEVNSYSLDKDTEFMNILNADQCSSYLLGNKPSINYGAQNNNCVYYNQLGYISSNLSNGFSQNNFQTFNGQTVSGLKDNNFSTSTQTYDTTTDVNAFNDISLNNIETQTTDDFLNLASDEFAMDMECMDIETQTHSLIDDFFFTEAQTQTSMQDHSHILFSNIETQTHH